MLMQGEPFPTLLFENPSPAGRAYSSRPRSSACKPYREQMETPSSHRISLWQQARGERSERSKLTTHANTVSFGPPDWRRNWRTRMGKDKVIFAEARLTTSSLSR